MYGINQTIMHRIIEQFRCEIYSEKLNSTEFTAITITSKCLSVRAVVSYMNNLIHEEISARESKFEFV